jgi:hypothetical protein
VPSLLFSCAAQRKSQCFVGSGALNGITKAMVGLGNAGIIHQTVKSVNYANSSGMLIVIKLLPVVLFNGTLNGTVANIFIKFNKMQVSQNLVISFAPSSGISLEIRNVNEIIINLMIEQIVYTNQ